MLRAEVICDGGDTPPQERYHLSAGPLSLQFTGGELRCIRLGRREVLRRIYMAVRAPQWRTVPAEISNLSVDSGPNWFRIAYDARHRWGDIDFCWTALISGDPQGTIQFAMDGRALTSFLRNRIGICVLHPIDECAGRPCIVEHGDGSLEEGRFPRFIAPHQPFKDIRALTHTIQAGVQAQVCFAGETFEMEDQRNWTDVSFKTYSTPLDLPFPVAVAAGEQIRQSVTLSLMGQPPAHPGRKSREITLAMNGPAGPLPRIGLCVASHSGPLTDGEIHRLRALHLSHLRVELCPSRPDATAILGSAAGQARAVGVPLEVALVCGQAPDADFARPVRPAAAYTATGSRLARPARGRSHHIGGVGPPCPPHTEGLLRLCRGRRWQQQQFHRHQPLPPTAAGYRCRVLQRQSAVPCLRQRCLV